MNIARANSQVLYSWKTISVISNYLDCDRYREAPDNVLILELKRIYRENVTVGNAKLRLKNAEEIIGKSNMLK